MALPWASTLITREPKQYLNVTKSKPLILKVGFGHLSVTLSNACGIYKVCRRLLHIFNGEDIRYISAIFEIFFSNQKSYVNHFFTKGNFLSVLLKK